MNRKHLIVTLVSICLFISLAYSFNNLLNTPSSDKSKSDLSSSMPGHSLKLQSLTTAMAQSGLSSMESGVSFLVAEAGFCVYGNFGQQINLTQASGAFRGLEYQNPDYIIGSVPIPGFTESEDAHVYVHKTGWIVSYYTKTEYIAKIIKNFMTSDDNKIEDAIAVVSSTLSIAKPTISYYDFRYPNANTLMVVGDQAGKSFEGYPANNTFRIYVPSEIANNISKFEWYFEGDGSCQFGMHGQIISSGAVTTYGTISLVPSSKPDELLQPADLKLDTQTVVQVYAYSDYQYTYRSRAGFIILLHYD